MNAYSAANALSNVRCHAYTKSCARTGSPFDHFASRNSNVYVFLSSLIFTSFAIPGVGLLSLSRRYKPSIAFTNTRKDTESVDLDVSIEGISAVSSKFKTCLSAIPLFDSFFVVEAFSPFPHPATNTLVVNASAAIVVVFLFILPSPNLYV
ncbi:Uncharacterised protein [Streptococcus pneumoniae]|nr:Uncharacterised protein [Streptococcus pneumoniae]CJC44297.1 Uncharacterised protein [Streptococcus pneumoniae]CJG91433.1 Uncharacterised protein [Streptococcus pneumoniae]